MVQAAQQIDRFGFQERIVTAYGRIGKEGSIDRMQRSDAVHMLQEDHAWKKARVCPDRRKLVALFLSLGLALVLSFVPSPAHKQAQQRHAIRQEAREKEKEIQKVMDVLKQTDTSSMTKEQKKALQELIQSLALSQKKCSRQIRSSHWHLLGRNFPTSMDRRHRFPGRMPWHRYLKISR